MTADLVFPFWSFLSFSDTPNCRLSAIDLIHEEIFGVSLMKWRCCHSNDCSFQQTADLMNVTRFYYKERCD